MGSDIFIKHTMSLKLIFEIPVSPAEILTNSSLPNGKYNELHNYCQARYGTKLPECRKQIAKSLLTMDFTYQNKQCHISLYDARNSYNKILYYT